VAPAEPALEPERSPAVASPATRSRRASPSLRGRRSVCTTP